MNAPSFVEHVRASEDWSLTDFTRDGYQTILVSPNADISATDAFLLTITAQEMGYVPTDLDDGMIFFEQADI